MHANITLRKSEEGENEEGNERAFEPIFNQLKPVSGKIPLSELIHFCVNTSITPTWVSHKKLLELIMSCYPNRSLDASEFTYKEFKDFLKALSRKTSNPSMNSSEKFLNFIGKIKIHCKNSFKINLSDRPDAAKLKKPLQKHTASHNSVSKHSSIALEDTHPNLSQKRKKPSSVTDLPKLHKGIKFDLKPATQVFNQESKKVLEKEGILSLLEKFSTKETTKEKTLQLTEKFREFKSQIGQFIPHSPAFSNAKSTNFVIKQRKKLFSSQLIKSAIFASWKAYLISKKQKI